VALLLLYFAFALVYDSRGIEIAKFHNFARTISRHADGISRYSVPPSAGPLLPLVISIIKLLTLSTFVLIDECVWEYEDASMHCVQATRRPTVLPVYLCCANDEQVPSQRAVT